MCGIAGEIRFDVYSPSLKNMEEMLDCMQKRGPDGHGIHATKNIAFGHRRLKIIDLSELAHQPMVDHVLNLAIVFNGCIYNYQELRKELEDKGYTFFSHGDTEVIIKAYHAWGEKCVTRFNGMFAFAIWEYDSGRVFMARDRFGIKPLYIHKTENFLRFASFLPALLKMPDVSKDIDAVALNHFLTFRSIIGSHTLFKSIRKLPPATTMMIEPDGTCREKIYWKLSYQNFEEDKKKTENEWIEQILEAFQRSVKRRLVSDVPVGVLLSGGLDSSLIVGMFKELGQKKINTFSIGFESVAGIEGDEFKYSDFIARHYNTQHQKIFCDHNMLKNNLADCIKAMSDPMVSHDVIGFYLLSQEVTKHVSVVQLGQGADEIFGGYSWFPPMLETKTEEAASFYKKLYFNMNFDEYKTMVTNPFIVRDYAGDLVDDFYDTSPARSAIDKTLDIETSLMMVDDPVKRVDNMTMAASLEARTPFLDHELAELAARIPAYCKVAFEGKHILKEAARRIIPHEVIDRPKGYFPVPALKHMEDDYLDLARDIWSQNAARNRNIFRKDYIDNLLEHPQEQAIKIGGSKLWHATLLEYWLQLHL